MPSASRTNQKMNEQHNYCQPYDFSDACDLLFPYFYTCHSIGATQQIVLTIYHLSLASCHMPFLKSTSSSVYQLVTDLFSQHIFRWREIPAFNAGVGTLHNSLTWSFLRQEFLKKYKARPQWGFCSTSPSGGEIVWKHTGKNTILFDQQMEAP